MTVSIKDKEKVGIVGRTGAGKSSIGVALYRLVNPEKGFIRIGGVDTQKIGMCCNTIMVHKFLTLIKCQPLISHAKTD